MGNLLLPIPGSRYRHVEAKNGDGDGFSKYTDRHKTENLVFKDGNVYDAEELDPIAQIVGPASRGLELLPGWAKPLNFILLPTKVLLGLLNAAFYLKSEVEAIAKEIGRSFNDAVQAFGEAAANLFREVFPCRSCQRRVFRGYAGSAPDRIGTRPGFGCSVAGFAESA